ncbi:MAG: diaminopimelate epimerase [Fibrobacter sp.]|nr:diaminopimelate epimerase [Fibrobacter sp.]
MIHFTKMQGAGNDYIYVDNRNGAVQDPAKLSPKISDRHFGVGSDGLVLISLSDKADVRMRMFNPDGSEAEMCGNASRCVARFAWERFFSKAKDEFDLETGAGIKHIVIHRDGDRFVSATVDMGAPILEPKTIPVAAETNKILLDGREFTCVSMGNPHAVTFVESVQTAPVHTKGPDYEIDKIFPRKSNIEFCEVIDNAHAKMRVWERGTGETLACGTGACATLVACVLNGKTSREIDLELLGGTLHIEWRKDNSHVMMTGPAEFVFEGTFEE